MAVAVVVAIISSFVIFSQPAVLQAIKDAREKAVQKAVTAGKTTQQAADAQLDPTLLKVSSIVSSLIGIAAYVFLTAAFLWLLGTFVLRGSFSYMQAVEMVAAAMMIAVLGNIVTTALIVIYGDPSMTPSPLLVIGKLDPTNKVHVLLSALNVMTLWHVGVLSLGMARLCGASFFKCALWLYGLRYGLWALVTFGLLYVFGGR
jgi:hypothetical protein